MELRVLGPVELRDEHGDAVDIGGSKPRALLATLALHGHAAVSIERLTDLLWGSDVPGSPRSSIQSYVSRLRAVLGRDALEHAGGGYRLAHAVLEVDVRRSEELAEAGRRSVREGRASDASRHLAAALRLWRGRPLDGLGDIPLVGRFRPGLEEAQLTILEQRLEADLEAGHAGAVIPELEGLVAAHPFRERLHAQLMLALYAAGRQADALEEFRRARELLVSELGVEPGAELSSVHDRILAQDPQLSASLGRRPQVGSPAPASGGAHTGIVGRQEERALLRRLLEEAAAGRARFALVGGEAGIGKTRLLEDTAAYAVQQDARVLVGHCSDMAGRAEPYAPFAQLLRALVDGEGVGQLRQLMTGPAGPALGHLVPELARGAPVDVDVGQLRHQVFAAALHAVTVLSRDRPLLVGLEDLHWADRSTLDLLTFLVRNLALEQVLIVATFRSDDAGDDVRMAELLAELPRSRDVVRVDLAPFGEREVALQAGAILGRSLERVSVEQLTRRSGGNPFYVEELLAPGAPGCQLPTTVRDVVRGRLGVLTARAADVLAHVAVVGRPVAYDLLERTASLHGEQLDGAVREALGRSLLVSEDGHYRFRHALVQEVVYGDLPPGRRRDIHRQVAGVLAAGTDRDPSLGEVAHHWDAAGEDRRAFEASLAAAEGAQRIGAFAEALHHYDRVLALWDAVAAQRDRTAVLEDAASAAGHAGRAELRVTYLREVLRRMPPDADTERRADVGSRLARALFDLGDDDAALRQAEVASRLTDGQEPSSVQVKAMSNYASMLLTSVRAARERAIPPARAAVAAARQVGDLTAEAHARERLGSALAWTGAVDEGIAELRRARDTARGTDDPGATMAAYFGLFFVLHDLARRYEGAREVRDEALAWLDVHGDRWAGSAGLLTRLSYSYLRTGQWTDAESLLDRVARQHLEGGQRMAFHTARATLRWMQGRIGEAASHLDRVRDDGPGTRLHQDVFPLAAELAADGGDVAAARATVRDHLRLDVEPSEAPMKCATLGALVRAAVDAALRSSGTERSRHVSQAQDALEEMSSLVATAPSFDGAFQLERPATYLKLAEAELSRVIGPDPDAWRPLVCATSYAYWSLHVGLRHAEALLACGRHQRGVEVARRVRERAERVGADGVRRRLDPLLVAG